MQPFAHAFETATSHLRDREQHLEAAYAQSGNLELLPMIQRTHNERMRRLSLTQAVLGEMYAQRQAVAGLAATFPEGFKPDTSTGRGTHKFYHREAA